MVKIRTRRLIHLNVKCKVSTDINDWMADVNFRERGSRAGGGGRGKQNEG